MFLFPLICGGLSFWCYLGGFANYWCSLRWSHVFSIYWCLSCMVFEFYFYCYAYILHSLLC